MKPLWQENNLSRRKFSVAGRRPLLAGLCLLALAGSASAQAPSAAGEARRLFSAAHQLTRGVDFSAGPCAKASPLLRAALEEWEKLPAAARDDFYPRLQLARCEIAQGEHASAAARLRQLLDAPMAPGNVLLVSEARLVLADLYAAGLGIARDEEKALGLYLLAGPNTWPDHRHRDRAAAELVYKLNGNRPSGLFHFLLERGGAPSNWLRSLEARRADNENRYDLVRLAITAIQSASFASDEKAEAEALQTLLETAGLGLLSWGDGERLPAAIVYLQRADTPAAQAALEALGKKLPHRLQLPDGSYWGHENDQ